MRVVTANRTSIELPPVLPAGTFGERPRVRAGESSVIGADQVRVERA
jgi:hypothetical protein